MLAIAIDGPSGVGKSTAARAVAAELGFSYVESGAMYRGIALLALESGTPLDDSAALGTLSRSAAFRFETHAGGNRIFLNGREITEAIRSAEVTRAASYVSVHPEVRGPLVEQQRALARQGRVVMEGRDIGTVVLPGAFLKVFLDAPADVRGERRMKDLAGESLSKEAILRDISDRDRRDSTRETSPLVPAEDAIRIDTAELSAPDVARLIVQLANARMSLDKKPGDR
jgi:cytidylate kinase